MRRTLAMEACWLCLASGAAAAGAAATPQDLKAIDRCVAAARAADRFGSKCIGLVADPCIKAVQGHDNGVEQAKACAERELAVWTARLGRAAGAAKSNGFSEMAAALEASQKSWSASRDKLCPVFETLDPGAAPGGGAYCRLQETATRALQVERLVQATGEH